MNIRLPGSPYNGGWIWFSRDNLRRCAVGWERDDHQLWWAIFGFSGSIIMQRWPMAKILAPTLSEALMSEYWTGLIAAGLAAIEEGGDLDLDQMNPYYEQHLREAVRRIIVAACAKLKEPSEAMVEAGAKAEVPTIREAGSSAKQIRGAVTAEWRAMLSRLLTEIGT